MQRWKGQAREYRQKQLLDLGKPKHNSRLYVPDIARGVTTEDMGDPKVALSHVLDHMLLSLCCHSSSAHAHLQADFSCIALRVGNWLHASSQCVLLIM